MDPKDFRNPEAGQVIRTKKGLVEAGILKEVTGYARSRIFRADEIYKALEEIGN